MDYQLLSVMSGIVFAFPIYRMVILPFQSSSECDGPKGDVLRMNKSGGHFSIVEQIHLY